MFKLFKNKQCLFHDYVLIDVDISYSMLRYIFKCAICKDEIKISKELLKIKYELGLISLEDDVAEKIFK